MGANIDSKPGDRTFLLMRAQSFWRKQQHEKESTPNTMKLSDFAAKLSKEVNMKAKENEKSEKRKDSFFLRANSIIPKSYQNESGMIELSEREVFRRLLLNFSVKRSKYFSLSENLRTH